MARKEVYPSNFASFCVGAWEIGFVLALVVGVFYLFVREVLPIAITAMLAAALLMIVPATSWDGAILSPEEGLSGFASSATIAVLAMFVLSAGIERSGSVEYVTQFLTRFAGKSPRRQALSLGAVAGPLSGFVNNTPVVGVMIPVAAKLARQAGHSPSKLLMPLSFFAMLGGTLTLIGTSTNLLGNALLPQHDLEPFAFFSFTLVGVVGLLVTAIYFGTIGMHLTPEREDGTVLERFDLKGFMAEFEVPDDSAAAGKTLRELELSRHHGLQVIRAFRGRHVIASPRQGFRVRAGDVFLVQGSRERLEGLPKKSGLASLAELKHGLDDVESSAEDGETREDDDRVATAELVLAPGSPLEGKTLAESQFRDGYDALVLAVRHRDRVVIGPLANARLEAGDVLLVQGHPDALARLEHSANFLVTRTFEKESFRTDKILLAVGILAAVVTTSALGWVPIVAAALAGAVAMVLTGCLRIQEFIDAVHWDIVLLLAGIIPLGVALTKSGAAALLGSGLIAVGIHLPPIWFLILVFAATSVISEMVSNNAAVVLLLPIAVTAAAGLGLDGRPFALAVMLAASTAMLTPVGYQTNTMIYAPGNYRFSDYARVGGPLNLILVIVIPLTIAWLFPLQ